MLLANAFSAGCNRRTNWRSADNFHQQDLHSSVAISLYLFLGVLDSLSEPSRLSLASVLRRSLPRFCVFLHGNEEYFTSNALGERIEAKEKGKVEETIRRKESSLWYFSYIFSITVYLPLCTMDRAEDKERENRIVKEQRKRMKNELFLLPIYFSLNFFQSRSTTSSFTKTEGRGWTEKEKRGWTKRWTKE